MAIEIEGRIVEKLQPVGGVSARGNWTKQDFILEYEDGKFPTRVCINVWGEEMVKSLAGYAKGDTIKASLKLSSREYNGRWYTEIRAWKIEKTLGAQQQPQQSQQSQPQPQPQPRVEDIPSGYDEFADQADDLPF